MGTVTELRSGSGLAVQAQTQAEFRAQKRTEDQLLPLTLMVAHGFLGVTSSADELRLGRFTPKAMEARMVAVGMAAELLGYDNPTIHAWFHLKPHEFDALAVACHRWEAESYEHRMIWRDLKAAISTAISETNDARPCDSEKPEVA